MLQARALGLAGCDSSKTNGRGANALQKDEAGMQDLPHERELGTTPHDNALPMQHDWTRARLNQQACEQKCLLSQNGYGAYIIKEL